MSQQKILLRVGKGQLLPADGLAAGQLRDKEFRIGDQINAVLTKARHPGFHRLSHQFGTLVARSFDDFDGLDAHQTLKRLQWLADVECEHVAMDVPGYGTMTARWPRSMSFASMDEGRFRPMIRSLARFVAEKYWRDEVDADEVLAMAEEIVL